MKRRAARFAPQPLRVITRLFKPGGKERIRAVIDRILRLSEDEVVHELDAICTDFAHRHRRFLEALLRHYREVAPYVPNAAELTRERQLLIGAYFTHEYSISAAALFNPSIVLHPDQDGLPAGTVRFIMSFRATGEGHISSVEFRSGTIDADNQIVFDSISSYVEIPEVMIDRSFHEQLFGLKLREMGVDGDVYTYVLDNLGDEFTLRELEEALRATKGVRILSRTAQREAINAMMCLATSHYTVRFPAEHDLSERVLFPVSENESRGIEDARFVRFIDDDGSVTYYATYTAYNGLRIRPQLIETTDFITFKIRTLNGKAVQDKGMALFPRRINGRYVMLSRQDGQNLYIMYSDNIHFWDERSLLEEPRESWEFIQIGNNGSPLETEIGWLVLTHGVGAMRTYCIGCTLLDLHDPSRIIGRLARPLLAPNTAEREGYVPNVLYTCGAMIHGRELIMPYSMADSFSGIATIPLDALLERLRH